MPVTVFGVTKINILANFINHHPPIYRSTQIREAGEQMFHTDGKKRGYYAAQQSLFATLQKYLKMLQEIYNFAFISCG